MEREVRVDLGEQTRTREPWSCRWEVLAQVLARCYQQVAEAQALQLAQEQGSDSLLWERDWGLNLEGQPVLQDW